MCGRTTPDDAGLFLILVLLWSLRFLGYQASLVSGRCRPRTGIRIRDLTMLANISSRADMAIPDNVGASPTVHTIASTLSILR